MEEEGWYWRLTSYLELDSQVRQNPHSIGASDLTGQFYDKKNMNKTKLVWSRNISYSTKKAESQARLQHIRLSKFWMTILRESEKNAIFLANYIDVRDNSKFDETKGLKETNTAKYIFLLLGRTRNKSLYCTEIDRSRGGNGKIADLVKFFSRILSNLNGNIWMKSRTFTYTQEWVT